MTDNITVPRALLEQALTAMKFGLHVGFEESSESQIKKGAKAFQQHNATIAALRSALEQPQQPKTNQCGETCERAKLCAVCARGLEEPQQEPKPAATYAGETWCGSVVRLYEDLPLGTDLYTAPVLPQQDPRACGGRNCGSLDPRYHSRECFTDQQPQAIDHYEAALKAAFPEGASGAVYDHWNEARRLQQDTALLRHCLDLIEGEWPADDPAAGPLMVKLRQRLGVQP